MVKTITQQINEVLRLAGCKQLLNEELDTTIFYHGTPVKLTNMNELDNSFWSTDKEFTYSYGKWVYSAYIDLGNAFDIMNKQHFDWLLKQNDGSINVPATQADFDEDLTISSYNELLNIINITDENWEIVEQYLDIIKSKFQSVKLIEGGTINYCVFNADQIHLLNDKPEVRQLD